MFKMNDPFFRPLWLRVLLVAICVFWTVVELWTGSPGWAMLFAGLGGYAAYSFFIVFNPTDPEKDTDDA